MSIYDNDFYKEDVCRISSLELPWAKLQDRSIVLSGATGMIGSFLVDVILHKNELENLNCSVYAIVRNINKAQQRFSKYIENSKLRFIIHDVNSPLIWNEKDTVDYVLHLASNTHPYLYATDPIGTITTNISGVQHLLDFAVDHHSIRFVFASSNEIYGENRGDVELFDEDYCGYINCNTLRAAYPESKRCGEALCQAYKSQKDLNVAIARITRTYGPTMAMSDTKALSQFLNKAIAGEDIVLKSDGTQYYSYTYMADAVSGLLCVLLSGENGEAYNIADENSDIQLKELANIIAEMNGKKVVFEMPDEIEAKGYSKATKARLCGNKVRQIGWIPQYSINEGLKRTISILKDN